MARSEGERCGRLEGVSYSVNIRVDRRVGIKVVAKSASGIGKGAYKGAYGGGGGGGGAIGDIVIIESKTLSRRVMRGPPKRRSEVCKYISRLYKEESISQIKGLLLSWCFM